MIEISGGADGKHMGTKWRREYATGIGEFEPTKNSWPEVLENNRHVLATDIIALIPARRHVRVCG